jgi:hypothetical protein
MNSMAENYFKFGGVDIIESTPVHIDYDVVLWLFADWSSLIEYRNSGRVILQESFHNDIVPVDETAPITTYSWR